MKPQKRKFNVGLLFFIVVFFLSFVMLVITFCTHLVEDIKLETQGDSLRKIKSVIISDEEEATPVKDDNLDVTSSEENALPEMLPEYEQLYGMNSDLAGWLFIEDTCIDYPVMQTPEDENYYLRRDFYGEDNRNGCLILDTQSFAGIGTYDNNYGQGQKPTTNMIIHGHTMRTGAMFGDLDMYQNEEYGLSHKIICFDSLYERREYELIAAFYSQVYEPESDEFKYYSFFQADKEAEFEDWYENIKKRALYDTGVTAEYGDEFITLSCCSYHVSDGRFVVIGKRIP